MSSQTAAAIVDSDVDASCDATADDDVSANDHAPYFFFFSFSFFFFFFFFFFFHFIVVIVVIVVVVIVVVGFLFFFSSVGSVGSVALCEFTLSGPPLLHKPANEARRRRGTDPAPAVSLPSEAPCALC